MVTSKGLAETKEWKLKLFMNRTRIGVTSMNDAEKYEIRGDISDSLWM